MSGASKGGGVRGEEGRLRERGAPVASGDPSSLWLGVAGMCVNRQALAGSLGCCEPSLAGSTALSKAPALGRGASLSAFFLFLLVPLFLWWGPASLAGVVPLRSLSALSLGRRCSAACARSRDRAARPGNTVGRTAGCGSGVWLSRRHRPAVSGQFRPGCYRLPPLMLWLPATGATETGKEKKKMTAPPRGRRAYPRRFPAP